MTSYERMNNAWKLFRDIFVTVLGGSLLAYEALRSGGQGDIREVAVAAYLFLMGAPSAVRLSTSIKHVAEKAEQLHKENTGEVPITKKPEDL